jgi:hypothetical protein
MGRSSCLAPCLHVLPACWSLSGPAWAPSYLLCDSPVIADRWCNVVSVADPHGRILGFLGRIRYFFFEVAPQLCSRG